LEGAWRDVRRSWIINQSINQSINQTINQSINQSTYFLDNALSLAVTRTTQSGSLDKTSSMIWRGLSRVLIARQIISWSALLE
jgi:hypothetical protein